MLSRRSLCRVITVSPARDIRCQTGAEGARRAVSDWLGQSLLAAEVGDRGEQAPEPRPLAGVAR